MRNVETETAVAEASLEYIRDRYGVPAHLNGRVEAMGQLATITGASGAFLLLRVDGETTDAPWNPTWHMKYLDEGGAVTWHRPCPPEARCWHCTHGGAA